MSDKRNRLPELSLEERQEIWEGLERRMEEWETKHPRRKRRGPLWRWMAAGSVLAVLAGVAVTYTLTGLPGTEQASPSAPSSKQQGAAMTAAMQIAEIERLASEGRAPDCPFGVGASAIGDVEQLWGQADKVDAAGRGMYATYAAHGFAFGFDAEDRIFDVRSFASDIRAVKLSDVKKELGDPVQVNRYQDAQYNQDIWVYERGDYLLELVFPHVTANNADPNLDHISVIIP